MCSIQQRQLFVRTNHLLQGDAKHLWLVARRICVGVCVCVCVSVCACVRLRGPWPSALRLRASSRALEGFPWLSRLHQIALQLSQQARLWRRAPAWLQPETSHRVQLSWHVLRIMRCPAASLQVKLTKAAERLVSCSAADILKQASRFHELKQHALSCAGSCMPLCHSKGGHNHFNALTCGLC